MVQGGTPAVQALSWSVTNVPAASPGEVLPVHSASVLNPASAVEQLTGPGLQLHPWPATIAVQPS